MWEIKWLMLKIYHIRYWFTKIKVSSYPEKLIIIDDLAHLQHFIFKQFRVSIGLGFISLVYLSPYR